MSNIPNAPGMPAGAPTQADIASYNSWAARYGQPCWAAAAAPMPAPKAKAKAKAKAKVRSRSERRNQPPGPGRGNWGQSTPQLPSHGTIGQAEGGGWIRGTYARDRNVYARRSDGTEKKLMAWMPRLGKMRLTKDSRNYYSHNRQQFIINLPAIAYTLKPGSGEYIMCTVGHIVGGEPARMIVPHDVEAADLDQDVEGLRPALWIQSKVVINTEDSDKYRVLLESQVVWIWDEASEMTFDE